MAEVFTRQIYLNLAVRDLKKTMDFFSKLGFGFNPKSRTRTPRA
jgi:Predicted lactoylglutathione lyase